MAFDIIFDSILEIHFKAFSGFSPTHYVTQRNRELVHVMIMSMREDSYTQISSRILMGLSKGGDFVS